MNSFDGNQLLVKYFTEEISEINYTKLIVSSEHSRIFKIFCIITICMPIVVSASDFVALIFCFVSIVYVFINVLSY